MNSDVIDF